MEKKSDYIPIDRKKLLPKSSGTSRNDHTGKYMRTKPASETYKKNYDEVDWSYVRELRKQREEAESGTV